ncbi:MAG: hypothetical protein JXO44_04610 [Clostridia bacterium]|nr:hypothetical protein [Clostridia bacterium]
MKTMSCLLMILGFLWTVGYQGNSAMTEGDLRSPLTMVYAEEVTVTPEWQMNEEKVATALEMGFSSPDTKVETGYYTPSTEDVIQYTSQANPSALWESLTHRGFDAIEAVYERKQYMWHEFFDELDVTEYERTLTLQLKGDNIYESDIVDDYEKYYRYYNVDNGLYYEVQDLMMGNFLDPEAVLTNKKLGMVCNYGAISSVVAPSHNPLILNKGETWTTLCVAFLEERPCIYMESLYNEKLYKRWIDIEWGIMTQELVFDDEGLLVDEKKLISLVTKEIDDAVFNAPTDIDYKDITMFIYIAEGGDMETLALAIGDCFPEGPTGVELVSEDQTVTLYTKGVDALTPNLEDVVYVSYHTDNQGRTSRIREIAQDRYYTVHDGLKVMEIYDASSREKKFFNFEDVVLLNVEKTETGMTYAFYDPQNISVSGLYEVYQYVIMEGQLTRVNNYEIESIYDNQPVRRVVSYEIKCIDFDTSVYDEGYFDTYKIIDHGEGSQNDGENMPFWYE